MSELEHKYEVTVNQREKAARLDKETKEVLKKAGMIKDNKLKIGGVSPRMLKIMKAEYVDCPVMEKEIHFVQCYVCPNFQSRLKKMVMCKGEPLPDVDVT